MWGYVIDWGAWATFATGVMAVGAALKVGLKQTAIAERQLAILDRQSEIELAKHTADLFDRRYAVYDAVLGYLVEIIKTAARPDRETQMRFHSAVALSGLLFKPAVKEKLDAISKQATTLFFLSGRIDHQEAEGRQYDSDAVERRDKIFDEMTYDAVHLPAVFGDELVLAQR